MEPTVTATGIRSKPRRHRRAKKTHAPPTSTANPRNDLKLAREERGWSQTDLATMIGSHAQTIDKIERGQIRFSRFLPKIERQLGLAQSQPPPASMSSWRETTEALDIEAIKYALAYSPDGKRKALLITWTLRDGSTLRGAMDLHMMLPAAREFYRVAQAAGIDLAKLSQTPTPPE